MFGSFRNGHTERQIDGMSMFRDRATYGPGRRKGEGEREGGGGGQAFFRSCFCSCLELLPSCIYVLFFVVFSRTAHIKRFIIEMFTIRCLLCSFGPSFSRVCRVLPLVRSFVRFPPPGPRACSLASFFRSSN